MVQSDGGDSRGGVRALIDRKTAAEPVTVDNFNRAESDLFGGILKEAGALGKFHHSREPANIDHQTVIRLNRDTLIVSPVRSRRRASDGDPAGRRVAFRVMQVSTRITMFPR